MSANQSYHKKFLHTTKSKFLLSFEFVCPMRFGNQWKDWSGMGCRRENTREDQDQCLEISGYILIIIPASETTTRTPMRKIESDGPRNSFVCGNGLPEAAKRVVLPSGHVTPVINESTAQQTSCEVYGWWRTAKANQATLRCIQTRNTCWTWMYNLTILGQNLPTSYLPTVWSSKKIKINRI